MLFGSYLSPDVVGAACVTETIRLKLPLVTVMVPLRLLVPVLAVALIVNDPFPVRLLGDILEMVNHVTLLVGVFQVALEVTVILVLAAADPALHVVGDNVRVGVTVVVEVKANR